MIADDSAPPGDWDVAEGWRPSTFVGGSPGAIDPAPIPLRITEVHYHPQKPNSDEELAGYTDDSQFEFIEIRNVGTGTVELAGVQLSDAVDFTFPAASLAPGAFVLVVGDLAAFTARYGGGLSVAGAFASGTLSDSGERLILSGASGETIHEFKYDDDWYPVTDGEGASLVIRDQSMPAHTWGDSASWRASTPRGGSPAAADPPAPPALRITEIMFHPASPSQAELDAGYSQGDFDFIELANTGATPIDLGTYSISGGLAFNFPSINLDRGQRPSSSRTKRLLAPATEQACRWSDRGPETCRIQMIKSS